MNSAIQPEIDTRGGGGMIRLDSQSTIWLTPLVTKACMSINKHPSHPEVHRVCMVNIQQWHDAVVIQKLYKVP